MTRFRLKVIPFYISLSLFGLSILLVGYNLFLPVLVVIITAYLNMFAALFSWDWSKSVVEWLLGLQPALLVPYEILVSWLIACLLVCVLLYLWLKLRTVAIIVTLLLTVVWVVLVFGYARGGVMPESVARVLRLCLLPLISPEIMIAFLVIAVPGLPVLWLLEPFYARAALMLLVFPWILLIVMGKYQAGIAILLAAVATYVIFRRALLIASGYLLPSDGKSVRRKALSFLRDFTLGVNYPACVVVSGLYEEDRVEERIRGNVFAGDPRDYEDSDISAIGPGIIICDCDHAVAITSGTKFKGVKGPGVVFTGYAERAKQIIDLRPQLRTFHVQALTKDGVKIKTLVFVPCKIDSRGRQSALGEPLPYNKSAAFRAFQAQPVEHESDEAKQVAWEEMPRRLAIPILQDIISKYAFDDLYAPYRLSGSLPRAEIANEFIGRLSSELEPLGIRLVGGGISDLQPADPEVYVKRAGSWQKEWEHEIALRQAAGQAAWLRTVERAQAEAQADLILELGRQLEELSMTSIGFRPKQALDLLARFLDELMKQQPTLREVVPGETLQALTDIRKAVG